MLAVIILDMIDALQEQVFSAIAQSLYSKRSSIHRCKWNIKKNFFHNFLTIIKSDIWNVEFLYKLSSKAWFLLTAA